MLFSGRGRGEASEVDIAVESTTTTATALRVAHFGNGILGETVAGGGGGGGGTVAVTATASTALGATGRRGYSCSRLVLLSTGAAVAATAKVVQGCAGGYSRWKLWLFEEKLDGRGVLVEGA